MGCAMMVGRFPVRSVVFALGTLGFFGTIAELVASKHYQDPIQLIPFALCIVGLVLTLRAWWRPTATISRWAWIFMAVTLIGTCWGIYEHVQANLEFVHETRRHATMWETIVAAHQGSDPVLTPGALALTAALVIIGLALPITSPVEVDDTWIRTAG